MSRKLILCACLFLAACKKSTTTPAYNYDPVIAAYLSPDIPLSLTLSHQSATGSDSFNAPPLDSLNLVVSVGDSSYILRPLGGGVYADSVLYLQAGASVGLRFVYNNKVVTASTVIPPRPVDFAQDASALSVEKVTADTQPARPGEEAAITFTWDNTEGAYYMIVVQNLESSPERIIDTSVTNIDTNRRFRTRPEITDTYELSARSFTYFGYHRVILYRLNADYAYLYLNTNSNSQNLYTPSNGISNGVGIFTGINADTLYVQVNKG
ncbi:hypothetical protein [Rurimicrobium arvi]|uniref:DUF4249 family protein n=1 Tax=Rurimicrobium arvi TaxID=2049916 RepID=A0ABP8MXN2_9BACT